MIDGNICLLGLLLYAIYGQFIEEEEDYDFDDTEESDAEKLIKDFQNGLGAFSIVFDSLPIIKIVVFAIGFIGSLMLLLLKWIGIGIFKTLCCVGKGAALATGACCIFFKYLFMCLIPCCWPRLCRKCCGDDEEVELAVNANGEVITDIDQSPKKAGCCKRCCRNIKGCCKKL